MNHKHVFWIGISLIFILLVGGVLVKRESHKDAGKEYHKSVKETFTVDESSVDMLVDETQEAIEPTESETCGEQIVDFELLHEENEDIYAWIDIPGTDISYPIVQHPSDDSYYLNHTVEHVKGLPGSIYTESAYTSKDFSDFNSVIYGHDMNDQTMFGSLELYKDKSYLDEHSEIYIYMEDRKIIYDVYAAVIYDDRHISWTYQKEESHTAFLDSLQECVAETDYVNTELNPTTNSHLITLSTCIGNMPNNRYLVVGIKRE